MANAEHPALMAAPPKSAIGNLVDLRADEILLPSFMVRANGGVYLDPRQMESPAQLVQFIDRVFSSGVYLPGLDLPALARLMYPRTPAGATTEPRAADIVRIADDIRQFPQERRGLYKSVKAVDGGARVEYMFEPVAIERTVQVPIYGGGDENGLPVITGYETDTELEPATLDVDEFIAALWTKGVRSGIDIEAIRAAIASGRTERLTIAQRIDPVEGADATVNEQTDALHRDDSPAILPNGKIDLRHFKNRFPQVSGGTRLLKKIPRDFGKLGFDTSGKALEPAIPKDFELSALAGPGTQLERTEQGEFILAVSDGFLNIDTQSQVISVTEKIVNRSGVSLRTTGNLALSGDEYEEHGEVQERRVVDGKHMSFHANVYGSINSSGGRVHLLANLSGGNIRNTGGSIQVDKRATNAVLDARGGEVHIGQAEGVTVIAAKVKIEKAVGCDIVAEEVEIGDATACAITARRIHLARAGDRKGIETLVSVWVPDFSAIDKRIADIEKSIAETQEQIKAKQAMLDDRLATPEVTKYIAVNERIRSGALKLSPAQDAQWQQAVQKLARPLQEIRALRGDIDKLKANISSEQEDIDGLLTQRNDPGEGVNCTIDAVTGDVTVRTQAGLPGAAVHPGIAAQDMKKLRDPKDTKTRLFSDDSGSFSWTWTQDS